MQFSVLNIMWFCGAITLLSHSVCGEFVVADQQPVLLASSRCVTRTRVVTRTSYEINVVSTHYHTQDLPIASNLPQNPSAVAQTLIFGVEGTGCNIEACSICRKLVKCTNDYIGWYVPPLPAMMPTFDHD